MPTHYLSRPFSWLLVVLMTLAVVQPIKGDAGDDDYALALSLYKKNRWSLAAKQFEQFVEQHPKHVRLPYARLYLGLTFVNLEKYQPARDVLRQFIKDYPKNRNLSHAMYRVAESSYLLDDLKSARQEFEVFLDQYSEDSLSQWALPYLADTQLRLGDAKSSALNFKRSIQRFPKGELFEDSQFGLARAYEELKQRENAITLYGEVAKRINGARAAEAQFKLATLYLDSNKHELAAAEYAKLAKLFPASSFLHTAQLNSGFAYYRLGDFRKAIEQFESARSQKEILTESDYWRGVCHKKLGEFDRAIAILEETYSLVAMQPLAKQVLFQWADAHRRFSQFDEARKLYLDLVKQWPKDGLADDSLYFAAESALLAGSLNECSRLVDRMKAEYSESGLLFHRELLNGRLELAKAAQVTDADNAEAQELRRSAVARFQKVMDDSQLPLTRGQARMELAQAHRQAGSFLQAANVLEPLIKQNRSLTSATGLLPAFILHADCLVAIATTEWRQSHQLSDEAAQLVAEARKLSEADQQDAARVKTQVADQKRESGKLKIEAARDHVATATLSLEDFLKSVDSGPSAEQAWTLRAVCGVVQGRQDEVMSSLASLEKAAANRTDAMQIQVVGTAVHRIAEMTFSIGDWKWAAQLFAQLHALAPMHNFAAAGLSGQAWSQFELGQFELAAATFSQVVSKHAKHGLAPEAGRMVGVCLDKAGETEKAAAAFSLAAEKFAGTPDAYRSALETARLWRKQSDVEKFALNWLQRSDVAYQLAYQELLKQPKEKQESLDVPLDVLLDEWALLHYESENFKRADQLFELLLSKVPKSNRADNARYSLAESDRFAGELDRSKTDFRELEASSKSDRIVQEESLFQLIGIGIEQKDWKAVSTTYDQLSSRFPKSRHRFEAAFFLSDAQLNKNKLVEAEATLIALQQKQDDETVARERWYPHMWVRLAEVFFRRQNYTQVKATVEAFRRWDPESPFFYRAEAILGRSYKNQADKFDEARATFKRVINSKHGHRTETAAKCQLLIAETYYNGEDFEQALLEYLKVDFIYPFSSYQAPALLLAGQCHERLKQKAEAIMQYEELIKKFPKQESATTARERISTLKSKS